MQTTPDLCRPVPAFLRQSRPAGGPSGEDESPVDRLIRQGSLEGRTTPTEIVSLKGQPHEEKKFHCCCVDFKKIREVFWEIAERKPNKSRDIVPLKNVWDIVDFCFCFWNITLET